jgi:4-amino-4-deoxy-L-arabinose transferase-like glycosyltransferase
VVLWSGGIDTVILGVRFRATQASDGAIVAGAALLFLVWDRRRDRAAATGPARDRIAARFRRLTTPDGMFLTVLLAVAALARLWGLAFGLPHPMVRPDEDAVGAMAGAYYYGNLRPQIFDYPPLFMLAVALTLWVIFGEVPSLAARMNLHVGWPRLDLSAERIVARLLSAAAGVANVWLLYRVALRLFGRQTAFVSAAFLSLAFLHVRDSHFGVTDIAMTAMVTAGLLAIVQLAESGSRRDLIATGVLIGLAVATKYNAALLVLPAALAIVDDPLKRRIGARLIRLAALAALIAGLFVVISPYALLEYGRFAADAAGVSRHLSTGHGIDLGRGWTYHITTTLWYGMGPPLLVTGLAGLLLMVVREGRRGWLVALFPLAYYTVMGSGRTVFARYALPLVPFLCLSAGYAVTTAANWLAHRTRARWSAATTALLAAAILWPSARSVIAFDRLLTREDSRVIARRWIEQHIPPGATIAQIGAANAKVYVAGEESYVPAPPDSRPELIVIVSSPVTGAATEDIALLLAHEYDLSFEEQVVQENDPAHIYDRQDEFYLPLSGFDRIERPGPNVRIYVRRDPAR